MKRVHSAFLAVGLVLLLALNVWLLTRPSQTVPPTAPQEVEPLQGEVRLVRTLRGERLMQTIENLPEFDDAVWIMGTMPDGAAVRTDYAYDRVYYPRLGRVRKILKEARVLQDEDRAVVVNALRSMVLNAFTQYPQARTEFLEAVERDGADRQAPCDYDKCLMFASAGTYLLSELGEFSALPLMWQMYESTAPYPGSRLMLYYSMHSLAVRHPTADLQPDAIEALQEYLTRSELVPQAKLESVAAWDAVVKENDFRHSILKQDVGVDQQPQVMLRIYPEELSRFLDDSDGPSRLDDITDHLAVFINRAYGDSSLTGSAGGSDSR